MSKSAGTGNAHGLPIKTVISLLVSTKVTVTTVQIGINCYPVAYLKISDLFAYFYNVTGKKGKALGMYNRALEAKPDDIRIMDTVARFYFQNRQLEDAEKSVAEILKKRPKYFQKNSAYH